MVPGFCRRSGGRVGVRLTVLRCQKKRQPTPPKKEHLLPFLSYSWPSSHYKALHWLFEPRKPSIEITNSPNQITNHQTKSPNQITKSASTSPSRRSRPAKATVTAAQTPLWAEPASPGDCLFLPRNGLLCGPNRYTSTMATIKPRPSGAATASPALEEAA